MHAGENGKRRRSHALTPARESGKVLPWKRNTLVKQLGAYAASMFLLLGTVCAWAGAGDEAFDRGYESFVARDYQSAMEWWKKAAEQGHARGAERPWRSVSRW